MSDLLKLARQTRPFIEKAAQSLSDADGLKAKALYPRWDKLVTLGSVKSEAGYRKIPQALKYHRNFACGEYFAALLGEKLKSSPLFSDVDLVVAVPLHWTRRLKRGYNQAEVIASTVARVLGCRCESHLLVRNRRTGTQTRLSVEKKSANVKGAFSLNKSWKSDFNVKHILIVDDVFTTGATISECFLAIRSRFGLKVRISIATISIVGS